MPRGSGRTYRRLSGLGEAYPTGTVPPGRRVLDPRHLPEPVRRPIHRLRRDRSLPDPAFGKRFVERYQNGLLLAPNCPDGCLMALLQSLDLSLDAFDWIACRNAMRRLAERT